MALQVPETTSSLKLAHSYDTNNIQVPVMNFFTGQQKGPMKGEKRPKDTKANSQNHNSAHLRCGRDRNNLKLCKILFKNMISLEKITGGALKLLHICLRRENPTRIKNTGKK